MARKSTVRLARELLTPAQFKAWCASTPKLSASELRAGKKPRATGKRKVKAAPKRKGKRLIASLASDWDKYEGRYGAADTRRALQGNPPRKSNGQFAKARGYKSNPMGYGDLTPGQAAKVRKLNKKQKSVFWQEYEGMLRFYKKRKNKDGQARAFKSAFKETTYRGIKGGDPIGQLRRYERQISRGKQTIKRKNRKLRKAGLRFRSPAGHFVDAN